MLFALHNSTACPIEYTMNKSTTVKPCSERSPSIAKNTAIITTVSCLERALGFLYRIVLARLLGAEGLGLYQIALSHNLLFQTSAGGGIPVTLSRTVSRLNASGKSEWNGSALLASLLLGWAVAVPVTLALLPFAGEIPFFQEDASILKILILSLCATSAYAAIKGYLWGNKEFFLSSLLETAEQIFTVSLGVLFLSNAQALSPTQGAERTAWAHTLACVLSFIIALVVVLKRRLKYRSPRPFLKPMLRSATPITAVRVAATATGAAVAVLFPIALEGAGLSASMAVQAFGVVSGMVMPLLCAPLTIIGSLAIVLVPELAEAAAKRDGRRLRRNAEKALLFSIAIPCLLIPLFHSVGSAVGQLAYQNALAGEMISRCAFLLLPLSLNAILMSILNSLGYERKTLLLSLFGSAVFILGVLLLPRFVGVYAFPVALFLQLGLELVTGFLILKTRCAVSRQFTKYALIFIASTIPFCLLGRWLLRLFSQFFGEWLAPILAGILLLAIIALCYCAAKALFRIKKGKTHKKPLSHP